MEKRIFYNYSSILKKLAQYLPSRGLIILNSFLIIPLFTYILSEKEVSIYLIALQILNLICTCSFDWIGKAVLRFYEKYNLKNKLDEFLSTIFWTSIIVYGIIGVIYLLFKNPLSTYFSINSQIYFLTVLLVIPCGIRQIIYQVLRVNNNFMLYTASIILYQLIFAVSFLGLVNIIPNASSILLAMVFAVLLIDIWIVYSIHSKFCLTNKINKSIVLDILKYSIPIVFTNICYWFVFHSSKFIFQMVNQYLNTSVFGISLVLASNAVTPLASLFIFVNFPVIIKNFERQKEIKTYFTSMIRLYLYILFPVVSAFCYFSKDIVRLTLPETYLQAAYILPFLAITLFLHELMKLINIKYHLYNKTYIEMIFSVFIVLFAFLLNLKMITCHGLIGAACVMLFTEICLFMMNILIKLKNTNYISFKDILKTLFILFLISGFGFLISLSIGYNENIFAIILKLIIYLLLNYGLYFAFKKKLFI